MPINLLGNWLINLQSDLIYEKPSLIMVNVQNKTKSLHVCVEMISNVCSFLMQLMCVGSQVTCMELARYGSRQVCLLSSAACFYTRATREKLQCELTFTCEMCKVGRVLCCIPLNS